MNEDNTDNVVALIEADITIGPSVESSGHDNMSLTYIGKGMLLFSGTSMKTTGPRLVETLTASNLVERVNISCTGTILKALML